MYCSCPPFECICNIPGIPAIQQYTLNSPEAYQQPQVVNSYWTQEPAYAQSYPSDINNTFNQQYDLTNISTDLFQPEEIFQLDHPIKAEFSSQQNDLASSPPTLLDLGSGTIHREFKSEDYWTNNISNLTSEDSNNSCSSRFDQNQSPNAHLAANNNLMVPTTNQNYYMESAKFDDSSYLIDKVDSAFYTSTEASSVYDVPVTENKAYYPQQENYNNYEAKNFKDVTNEIIQYGDYQFLTDYDNRVLSDSTTLSDLDYKMQNYLSNSTLPFESSFHITSSS